MSQKTTEKRPFDGLLMPCIQTATSRNILILKVNMFDFYQQSLNMLLMLMCQSKGADVRVDSEKNCGLAGENLGGPKSEVESSTLFGAPATPPTRKRQHTAPWLRQFAFKPGQSGNPGGRPKEGPLRLKDYRKMFVEEMNRRGPAVIKACLDAAEQGDVKAIAIAMKYLMPEAKADSGGIDLELAPEATMEDRLAALVNKISTGEVSVEAGSIAARAMRDSIESAKTLEALQRMDTLQSEINAINKKGQGF